MEVKRGPNVDRFFQREEDVEQSKEEIALSGLVEKSYQQVENWINEITDLASAKEKLKVMAKVILAVLKQQGMGS